MAEETEKDPLGGLTDISTFLGPAKIEMGAYSPIPSVPFPTTIQNLPGGNDVPNKSLAIRDAKAGSPPYFPTKNASQAAARGANWVKALGDDLNANITTMQDNKVYAKMYGYDASPTGAYKDRYKAYGQDVYDRVGFHPHIDNESWFNANTTLYDDWKRSLSTSAWPLLSMGFMSPIKSYGSLFGKADIGQDTKEALDYQKYNELGYSTKGGVGGFLVNLQQSATYSMGILLEGALEGALIGAAVGAVEGGLPAIPGAAIGGATGFFKQLAKLPQSLYQSTKAMGKMVTALGNAAKISEARNLFKSAGSTLGNFANPFDNTKDAAMQYVFKNPDDLTNLARTARSVGALWHDVKNINLALSEGRLEGGFTENRIYERLYDEHYQMYGEAPDDKKQQEFREQARAGGFSNTLKNSALVFYSNKLVFPSITKASFLKGLPRFNFGTVVGNVGKEYQLIYTPGKNALEGAWTKERIGLMNSLKGLTKPKTLGRNSLNYFKRNLVEGFQEVSQEILADATEKYYIDTYYNPAAKNFSYSMATGAAATKNVMKNQGLEVFASGFAMGSILQLPSSIMSGLSLGYNRFKNRENWSDHIKQREKDVDLVLDSLNTLTKDSKYFFDPKINNYVTQMLVGKVISAPDEHNESEIKDSGQAAFFSAVRTSLRSGTFDHFLKTFESYKEATPQEIEEAWDLEPGEGTVALQNIDKAVENAKVIAKRYDAARSKMKYYLNLDNVKPDTKEYEVAKLYNEAYLAGIDNLIFMQSSFDDNLQRQEAFYSDLGKISVIRDSNFSDFSTLADRNRLNQNIAMLQTEVDTLTSMANTESSSNLIGGINELQQKKKLLEALTNFREYQDQITDEYINNLKYKQLKDTMMQNDSSLTEESAEIEVLNQLIDEFESGQLNPFVEYRQSFVDVLHALAGSEENIAKLEHEMGGLDGIDEYYSKLLELHVMRNQNIGLSKYINMLSDPKGFYEHVDKNYTWMKKLYDDRQNYYKDIVNTSLTNIERNRILNSLASKNVYVDLSEFADWVEDHSNLPSYFIDEGRGLIVNKDSVAYNDYVMEFIEAARLEEVLPAGDPLTEREKLDTDINELNDERNRELEKARVRYDSDLKELTGYTEQELLNEDAAKQQENRITQDQKAKLEEERKYLETSLDVLTNSSDPVRIEAVLETAIEKDYLTIELYDQVIDQVSSNPEKIEELRLIAPRFARVDASNDEKTKSVQTVYVLSPMFEERLADVAGLLETPEYIPLDLSEYKPYQIYQETTRAINDKYDAAIQNLKDEFEARGFSQVELEEYTVRTPFDNLPDELQQELTEAFNQFLGTIEIDPNLANVDFPEYERLRNNWIEGQSQIFDAYNKRMQDEAVERAKKLAEPPFLKFNQFQVNANIPDFQITGMYNRMNQFLEDGEYAPDPKKPEEVVLLTDQQKQDLKDDIKALEGYMAAKAAAYQATTIAEDVMNKINKFIINRQDELVDTFDEDGLPTGRRFADSPPDAPAPYRSTQIAEEIDIAMNGKEPFLYNRLKDGTIQKEFNLFMKDTSIPIRERVEQFLIAFERKATTSYRVFNSQKKLADLRESILAKPTEENLVKTLQRLAYREFSGGGDIVDAASRRFLTLAVTDSGFLDVSYNSVIKVKDKDVKLSDVMSKKAFDYLFHPVTGKITKLRNDIIAGNYQILAGNVKVFDKSLRERGITGELDLLLVNPEGKLLIVDLKTGKLNTWENFGKENKWDKSTAYRAQQSIYSNLVYNMSGLDADIALLPMAMDVNTDGYIKDLYDAPILKEGEDIYMLEYLPEVEQYGVTKNFQGETIITEEKGETVKPKTQAEKTIPPSDTSNITLNNHLNKTVIYEGKIAKLVRLDDNSFAVEIVDEGQEVIEEGEDLTEKTVRIIDLDYNFSQVKDGNLLLNEVGLTPVVEQEKLFEVDVIDNEVIDAKFEDDSEKYAIINGVRYKVNRSNTQAIVSLTYNINDARIEEIENRTAELTNIISNLRVQQTQTVSDIQKNIQNKEAELSQAKDKQLKASQKDLPGILDQINTIQDELKTLKLGRAENKLNKTQVIQEIAKAQQEIYSLNRERLSLVENNPERTIRGGNANNMIFALNRLPNNFQRLLENAKPADQVTDLKEIARLSVSETFSKAIDEILAENYPEAMDSLIEKGVSGINKAGLRAIQAYLEETIVKLNDLGFTVYNSKQLSDDIINQINVLREIQSGIQLIKLTKNGRISKKQPKEVTEFFTNNPQEVQQRANVSEIQEPTKGQAKAVPRQATREEFEKSLNKARDIIRASQLNEDLALIESQKTEAVKKETQNFIDKVNRAKTEKGVDKVFGKALVLANKNPELVDIDEVSNAVDERKKALNISLELDTLDENTYLILKTKISDTDYKVGDIFRFVKSDSEGDAIIENVRDKEQYTFKQEELINTFDKKTKEALEMKLEEVPSDPDTVSNNAVSIDEVRKDTEALDKAKESSDKSTRDERINNWLKNANNC